MNLQKQFLQAAHNNIPSSSAIYTYLDLIVDFETGFPPSVTTISHGLPSLQWDWKVRGLRFISYARIFSAGGVTSGAFRLGATPGFAPGVYRKKLIPVFTINDVLGIYLFTQHGIPSLRHLLWMANSNLNLPIEKPVASPQRKRLASPNRHKFN